MIYPQYIVAFQLLIALDLSSHYMQMYSSLTTGSKSHKTMTKNANPLLRLYYENRIVLFLVCAGNETFFMMLYLFHYETVYLDIVRFILMVTCPIFVLKQILNVVQLVGASRALAQVDLKNSNAKNKKH